MSKSRLNAIIIVASANMALTMLAVLVTYKHGGYPFKPAMPDSRIDSCIFRNQSMTGELSLIIEEKRYYKSMPLRDETGNTNVDCFVLDCINDHNRTFQLTQDYPSKMELEYYNVVTNGQRITYPKDYNIYRSKRTTLGNDGVR